MKKLGQIETISLSDQAIKKLKDRILSGQIAPSSHFIAEDIAKELGISRTPVRDALIKLASEGLLTYDGKGYVVVSFSAKDIRELYAVRRVLEIFALRTTFAHLTDDQVSQFRRLYERTQRRLQEKGEGADLMVKLDTALHQLIYDGSDNKRLQRILEDIREKLWFIHRWGQITRKIEYIETAKVEDFGEFLASLESRDVEKALSLMELHLGSGEEFTLECLGFS